MILNDSTCNPGLYSRTLDIHVRLALPDVRQQKCCCRRKHFTDRSCSVFSVSLTVGQSLMRPGLESSRHFPNAVALNTAEKADGTRSMPATLKLIQVPPDRRSQSSLVPPYDIVQQTFILQQLTPNTSC